MNPKWGENPNANDRNYGLDCRNFILWVFKQAGLTLNRGFAREGSLNEWKGIPFKDARAGDMLEGYVDNNSRASAHVMLVIGNNPTKEEITVAESVGGTGVIKRTYKYSALKPQYASRQNIYYYAYDMDGMYNNNGPVCIASKSDAKYRVADSCHIPISRFPTITCSGSSSTLPPIVKPGDDPHSAQ